MLEINDQPQITDVVLSVPSVDLVHAADDYLHSVQGLSTLRGVKAYERLTGNSFRSMFLEPENADTASSGIDISPGTSRELLGTLSLLMSVKVIPGITRAVYLKSRMLDLAGAENVPPITQPALVAEKIIDIALIQEEYGPSSRFKLDLKSRSQRQVS